MKKKLLSIVGICSLIVSMFVMPVDEVKASSLKEEIIDGSVLLNEQESVGEMLAETRGAYLQTGISSIGKVGTGKIKVAGTTIAQRVVPTIKVSVMVERLVNGDWLSYNFISASDINTYTVTTSKILTVPRGYYYRVRCVHTANSDVGSSNTSGIYVD